MNTNKYDEATAPTCCASSLVNGKTHYRSFKIPVGSSKCHQVTADFTITNTLKCKGWHDRLRNTFLFIMDEYSMASRPFWAWLKHQLEQACKDIVLPVQNNDGNIAQIPALYPIPDNFYDMAWGGVSIVCSFGDYHQLPPVGMNVLSDLSTPVILHTLDMHCVIFLNEYLIAHKAVPEVVLFF